MSIPQPPDDAATRGAQPPPDRPPERAAEQPPPPFQPAPPFFPHVVGGYPPAAPPAGLKRGFGQGMGVALGIGAVLCALSLISAIAMVALVGVARIGRANTSAETSVTKTLWGSSSAKNTLRAISVSGTIQASGGSSSGMFSSATYGYDVAKLIDSLTADSAAGLVLLMDTPGGSINGSRAIADAVDRYEQRTGKKSFAFVEGMSASGGMYAMAGVNRIYADQGTMVGSIGVIMGPFARYRDVTAVDGGLLGNGVTASGGIDQFYLTQGEAKDFGNAFRDMTQKERDVYTAGLSREYDAFVNWVSTSRGIAPETIRNDLGAYMFDAQTAKDKHLVDDVLGREEAFRQIARDAGVDPDQTKLVTDAEPGFLSSLMGSRKQAFGHGEALQAGEGVKASSSLCTGAPAVLAWTGDMNAMCGR
ncbi:S49 family peptidase [Propionibacterium freudenreichii]|uniref:S49 family peptidase n=1 Tax=Propionibacterium freudenreichii TaxID=1744 RepID=UPI00254BABA5|nr:S49 family peptidase [Propionibacterium freudenreichii]MDK9626081.1 S49 family peptidase [Propionibacterium freudenreichii]MDK9670036.1 S49 family peptidase [Propionibacterium freudenreichii]MDK9673250.1 S49 family peptidase [Propionibacterium freudenreichii]